MNGLIADLAHALRLHRGSPIGSSLAVLALAVSFAFVAAFLALWSHLGLQPHVGFEDADRLLTVGQVKGERAIPLNQALVEDARQAVPALAGLAGVASVGQRVSIDGSELDLSSELVTADYFSGLRPRLSLGRGFEAADHRADSAPVAVISNALWISQFDRDPHVLGRSLAILHSSWNPQASSPYEARIIGVMDESMTGTQQVTDVWLPYERAIAEVFGGLGGDFSRAGVLRVFGRLQASAGVDDVRAGLTRAYRDRATEFGLREDYQLDAVGGVVNNITHHRDALDHIALALAATLLVFVVAACNLSLYLLAQAPARRRELAVRRAVGAPMSRLIRQLATESLLISVVACALGLVLAIWLTAVVSEFPAFRHVDLSQASPLRPDILLVQFGVLALLGVLAAMAPIAVLARGSISSGSREQGRQGLWQRIAGSAQVTVAVTLGCIAAAICLHLWLVSTRDRGFEAEGVVAVDLQPGSSAPVWEQLVADRAQRRQLLLDVPGVEDVAFGNPVPGRALQLAAQMRSPATDVASRVLLVSADANYPALLGMRLLRGRQLDPGAPMEVLVNEALAQLHFGRLEVIGEVVSISAHDRIVGRGSEATIVGVLANPAFAHPAQAAEPLLFSQMLPNSLSDVALVRTELELGVLRDRLWLVSGQQPELLPMSDAVLVESVWSELLAVDRARAAVTAGAALVVLVLSALGFYGTLRYFIAAGQREYALRKALGAGPRAVRNLVLRRGLAIGLPGVLFGSVLGFGAVAALRGDVVLAGISAFAVSLVLGATALTLVLVFSFGPALQASRARPAIALREE